MSGKQSSLNSFFGGKGVKRQASVNQLFSKPKKANKDKEEDKEEDNEQADENNAMNIDNSNDDDEPIVTKKKGRINKRIIEDDDSEQVRTMVNNKIIRKDRQQ